MAKANPETILLKGDPIFGEAEANSSLTPGVMVEPQSNGRVGVHTRDGGQNSKMFVKENDIGGDDIDHAYASGEITEFFTAYPGCEVYAVLSVSQTVSVGTYLVGNNYGRLQVFSSDNAGEVVGIALEAKTTGSGATIAQSRIKIRIV